jgi:hypothetical protein
MRGVASIYADNAQHDVDRRDDQHGQQRRRGQAEQQRDRQPLEDRVGQDHRRADHRRERRQQDRLEADGAGLEQHVGQRPTRGAMRRGG